MNQILTVLIFILIFRGTQAKNSSEHNKFTEQAFEAKSGHLLRHNVANKKNSVLWPLVYPNRYKAIITLGTQKNKYSSGSSGWGLSFGASFEKLWEQTLFYGLGYQYNTISKLDSLEPGTVHRVSLQTGIIFQLDEYERHHLLFHIRPGMAFLKYKNGSANAFGVGIGLGYDFCLNSDFILAPEFIYNWYSTISDSPYQVSGWNFGLRFSFGS